MFAGVAIGAGTVPSPDTWPVRVLDRFDAPA